MSALGKRKAAPAPARARSRRRKRLQAAGAPAPAPASAGAPVPDAAATQTTPGAAAAALQIAATQTAPAAATAALQIAPGAAALQTTPGAVATAEANSGAATSSSSRHSVTQVKVQNYVSQIRGGKPWRRQQPALRGLLENLPTTADELVPGWAPSKNPPSPQFQYDFTKSVYFVVMNLFLMIHGNVSEDSTLNIEAEHFRRQTLPIFDFWFTWMLGDASVMEMLCGRRIDPVQKKRKKWCSLFGSNHAEWCGMVWYLVDLRGTCVETNTSMHICGIPHAIHRHAKRSNVSDGDKRSFPNRKDMQHLKDEMINMLGALFPDYHKEQATHTYKFEEPWMSWLWHSMPLDVKNRIKSSGAQKIIFHTHKYQLRGNHHGKNSNNIYFDQFYTADDQTSLMRIEDLDLTTEELFSDPSIRQHCFQKVWRPLSKRLGLETSNEEPFLLRCTQPPIAGENQKTWHMRSLSELASTCDHLQPMGVDTAERLRDDADYKFRFAVRPSVKIALGEEVKDMTTGASGIVLRVEKHMAHLLRGADCKVLADKLKAEQKNQKVIATRQAIEGPGELLNDKHFVIKFLQEYEKLHKSKKPPLRFMKGPHVFARPVPDLLRQDWTCQLGGPFKFRAGEKIFLVGRTFPLPPEGKGLRWYFESESANETQKTKEEEEEERS